MPALFTRKWRSNTSCKIGTVSIASPSFLDRENVGLDHRFMSISGYTSVHLFLVKLDLVCLVY